MAKKLFANNARGTLKVAATALDTALTLDVGQGALFPTPGVGEQFRCTLVDTLGNIEITKVTTRVADGFTVVVRGQEGTVPRAFPIGSRVSLRVTKETLEGLRDGESLGTMAQQNANAVAITGGAIAGVAITGGTLGGVAIDAVSGAPLPRSYLAGFGLANNAGDATNDIDVAVGACRSAANDANILLAAALTKQLDAVWAVGTGAGMRASGAAIANGTYHIFAIRRPDTAVVDIAADTSVTGANVTANTNANYTQMRRIGSILREAGAIVAFSQNGDEFLRKTAVLDVSANNPGAANVNRTLSVPLGLKQRAIMNCTFSFGANGSGGIMASLDETDQAPSNTVSPLETHGDSANWSHIRGRMEIRVDTSAQIRTRVNASDANVNVLIATLGWLDRRGRDD